MDYYSVLCSGAKHQSIVVKSYGETPKSITMQSQWLLIYTNISSTDDHLLLFVQYTW